MKTIYEWEEQCMTADPFAGDCDGESRILSDKIVTARKPAECHDCAGVIKKGERIRRRSEVFDGEFMRFAFCEECCKAMADDDDELLIARVELGYERRNALTAARGGRE